MHTSKKNRTLRSSFSFLSFSLPFLSFSLPFLFLSCLLSSFFVSFPRLFSSSGYLQINILASQCDSPTPNEDPWSSVDHVLIGVILCLPRYPEFSPVNQLVTHMSQRYTHDLMIASTIISEGSTVMDFALQFPRIFQIVNTNIRLKKDKRALLHELFPQIGVDANEWLKHNDPNIVPFRLSPSLLGAIDGPLYASLEELFLLKNYHPPKVVKLHKKEPKANHRAKQPVKEEPVEEEQQPVEEEQVVIFEPNFEDHYENELKMFGGKENIVITLTNDEVEEPSDHESARFSPSSSFELRTSLSPTDRFRTTRDHPYHDPRDRHHRLSRRSPLPHQAFASERYGHDVSVTVERDTRRVTFPSSSSSSSHTRPLPPVPVSPPSATFRLRSTSLSFDERSLERRREDEQDYSFERGKRQRDFTPPLEWGHETAASRWGKERRTEEWEGERRWESERTRDRTRSEDDEKRGGREGQTWQRERVPWRDERVLWEESRRQEDGFRPLLPPLPPVPPVRYASPMFKRTF